MKFINLVLLSLTLVSGVYAQGSPDSYTQGSPPAPDTSAQRTPAPQPPERPWDEARYQGAMKEMAERDQVNRSQTAAREKGLDMITTPENKEQIEKIKENWRQFDNVANEHNKAAVEWQYADANKLPNAQELRDRWNTLTGEVNQRNAQLAEEMRPYNRELDIKIAEGQLDMRPYNPDFVEQHRQELQQKAEGGQAEPTGTQEQGEQTQAQSQQGTTEQEQTQAQSQQGTTEQEQTQAQPQQMETQEQGQTQAQPQQMETQEQGQTY